MTDGVSYWLCILAIITLSAVSSLSTKPKFTGVSQSRQFQKNLAASKFNNDTKSTETNSPDQDAVTSSTTSDGLSQAEIDEEKELNEWEVKMRAITEERLNKWSKYGGAQGQDKAIDEVVDASTKEPKNFRTSHSASHSKTIKSNVAVKSSPTTSRMPKSTKSGRRGLFKMKHPKKSINTKDKLPSDGFEEWPIPSKFAEGDSTSLGPGDEYSPKKTPVVVALEAKIPNVKSQTSSPDESRQIIIAWPGKAKFFAPIFVFGSSSWNSPLSRVIRRSGRQRRRLDKRRYQSDDGHRRENFVITPNIVDDRNE